MERSSSMINRFNRLVSEVGSVTAIASAVSTWRIPSPAAQPLGGAGFIWASVLMAYRSSFGKNMLVQGSHTDVSSFSGGTQEPGADVDLVRGGSFTGPPAVASGPGAVNTPMVP